MSPRIIAFGVLCLLQLGAAASGIARHERTLTAGADVLLAVAPVDPADPFRGRYVTLAFDLEQGSHKLQGRGPAYDEPVYVVLKVDADRVATVDYVTADRPWSGLYLKADSGWQDSDTTIHVSLPFKRYYMNEALAPAAEEAYRQAIVREDGKKNYARVRLLDGRAVIEAVLLDGVPIERAARAHK
jgi:uncharacterized membrane-anchored protein